MVGKILLASILLVLLVPSASAQLEDLGCTKTSSGYSCPQLAIASNAEVTYLDDVECYSTENATCTTDCSGLVDIGCFGFVKVNRGVSYNACDTLVNATDISYNRNCRTEALAPGDNFTVLMNPEIIDYSACSKTTEEGIYIIHCPYFGRVQYINASVVPEGLVLLSAADIPGITTETIIVLALAIAIMIVALWILRPKGKPGVPRRRRIRRR